MKVEALAILTFASGLFISKLVESLEYKTIICVSERIVCAFDAEGANG